jgi:hypothetical protein
MTGATSGAGTAYLIGFLFRITDRSTRHKLTEQGLVFWKSE